VFCFVFPDWKEKEEGRRKREERMLVSDERG